MPGALRASGAREWRSWPGSRCSGWRWCPGAFRTDVSLAFLGSWVLLKLGRVLWLGQRPAVLGHQLLVGSLILFTFFMISDPKTTPDRGARRIGWACPWPCWPSSSSTGVGDELAGLGAAPPLAGRPAAGPPLPRSRFRWPSGQPSPQGVVAMHCPRRPPCRPAAVLPLLVLLHRARAGLLRLLRREGRHAAVQRVLPGGPGARRRPHRAHHEQRLPGRAQRVRAGRAGADRPRAGADPRRRHGRCSSTSTPTPRRGWWSTSTPTRASGLPDGRRRWRAAHGGWPSRRSGEKTRAKALGVKVEAQYTVGEYDILILSAQAEPRGSRPG